MNVPRYRDTVNIDPYYTLRKALAGRNNNLFHWICNEYIVQKVGSVTTHWHQPSAYQVQGEADQSAGFEESYEVYCKIQEQQAGLT